MTPRKPARLRCNMYFEFQHFPSRIWHLNYRRIQYSLRISAGDGDSGMCHAPHVAARAHIPLFRVASGGPGRQAGGSGSPGILSARHYQFQTRANPRPER